MVYPDADLFNLEQRSYSGKATEAAFLLGGIGTGNVSIGARGELRDWEIFNRPAKGFYLPFTFFSIWTKPEGGEPIAKVLESSIQPPHTSAYGYPQNTVAGLPRVEESTLHGKYPVAEIDFKDKILPVTVSLQAFTPLIPHQPEDSGIPGAVLNYRVKNTSDRTVDVTIAGSVTNPVGVLKYDPFSNLEAAGENINEYRSQNNLRGLFMYSKKFDESELGYGDFSLATPHANTTYKPAWYRGEWTDNLQEFWDDFCTDGQLNELQYSDPSEDKKTETGSLGVMETLKPGEEKEIQFILSWYFPNRIHGWDGVYRNKREGEEHTQNYYSNLFASSWDAADNLVKQMARLKRETFQFRDALFGSTLPSYVIEAMANNIPVIRSTTCFWLKDGNFFGFEGCLDEYGCCMGSCNHVWSYAQTMAFLFPSLERNMRKIEFLNEVEESGKMNFRSTKLFDSTFIMKGKQDVIAAADGQMGSIIRLFREWKLSGDDQFLKELWPGAKKALTFALLQWDTDDDLVLDGEQHVTYDIEFYGPNPLTSLLFLGALKAAHKISEHLGENESAQIYKEVFEKSSARVEELLWNGEFFVQRLEDVDKYKYQHGLGCLSDQLLGQELAHICGLGYLVDPKRIRSAAKSIFDYNFQSDFSLHSNCQRTYVMHDEKGLLVCTWPKGGRPKFPFFYSDEVWPGTEYHVASQLIFEGYVKEGLTIVKALRDRYDGIRRNPWDEEECGHHYVRSMSSWGLLIALSGFKFDLVNNEISFAPVIFQDDFQTFWSTGKAWGTYSQQKNSKTGEFEFDVKLISGDASGLTVNACGKQITL